jgi:hypothetical protein
MKKSIALLSILILLSGCSRNIPTPKQRADTADNIVSNSMTKKIYHTDVFDIFAYQSDMTKCQDKKAHIYIEGDGLAWITSRRISSDPTPLNPVALKLANKDTKECKIYLARPCQYTNNKHCSSEYWTSHRFSKEILNSYIDVLDDIKSKYSIKGYELYGFSGGGAIATLLASHRDDVSLLVTIAGNIDHDSWTKYHKISALDGSLNPIEYANKLKDTKQYHLLGSSDKTINYNTYKKYHKIFRNNPNVKHIIFDDYTHTCCWDKEWEKILNSIK